MRAFAAATNKRLAPDPEAPKLPGTPIFRRRLRPGIGIRDSRSGAHRAHACHAGTAISVGTWLFIRGLGAAPTVGAAPRPRINNKAANNQNLRSTIIFLVSAIALAGFRPFGQVWVQFMIVWQRYRRNGSSSSSRRSPVASSRLSTNQR
jgi:hypothetical protein